MNPAEHAQLLREVAKYLTTPDIEHGTIPAKSARLAARANLAAEEIEGREVPSDDASCNYARALIGSLGALRRAGSGGREG